MSIKAESALKFLSRFRRERRIHNSKLDSIVFIQPEQQPYEEMRAFRKPRGLWYGINQSWIEWCSSEEPGWVHDHLHEVILDYSKILRIKNIKEFNAFEQKFGMIDPMLKMLEGMMPVGSYRVGRETIDWYKVAEQYSGLEITPYLWEKRLTSMWYYGWDCASGCVWNADAIVSIHPFAFFDGGKKQYVSALQRKRPVVK
jgi:hypothetical protein